MEGVETSEQHYYRTSVPVPGLGGGKSESPFPERGGMKRRQARARGSHTRFCARRGFLPTWIPSVKILFFSSDLARLVPQRRLHHPHHSTPNLYFSAISCSLLHLDPRISSPSSSYYEFETRRRLAVAVTECRAVGAADGISSGLAQVLPSLSRGSPNRVFLSVNSMQDTARKAGARNSHSALIVEPHPFSARPLAARE